MPESEVSNVVVLLASCAGLLVLVLFLIIRISSRLARIERLVVQGQTRHESAAEQGPSVAETSPGGAFEAFLNEDPARRDLPKGEQFSAYRLWRQEKGMNWSNS